MEIEIYWDDLTQDKQKEIINKLGDNNNWDVIPISVIEIEENQNE